MLNNKINHALIMAAGRGIRMKPLTDDLPKAMAPFNGSTLISEGIKELKKYITNIHITVGYKGEMLSSHLMNNNVNSIINTENKGNCWWLFNSIIKNLNEPIFVLTCDNVLDINFTNVEQNFFDQGSPDCMIVPTKPVDKLEGDYISKDEKYNITYLGRKNKTELMCSGVQILNPLQINNKYQNTDSFDNLWLQLINKNSLKCANIIPSFWYAVDNVEQLDQLNLRFKKKQHVK